MRLRLDENKEYDVFMIGAGIMSSTLAMLLKTAQPNLVMGIAEINGTFSSESTGALNNAGTGHSGFCELNYDTDKSIKVCEAFEKSKQFWSYLVKKGCIKSDFINTVPHISFVKGQENVDELKTRYLELKKNCLFSDMEFSEDFDVLKTWMPLVMHKRNRSTPVAATRVCRGTDINFESLSYDMIRYLTINSNVDIAYYSEATEIKRDGNKWNVTLVNKITGEKYSIFTKFLFIGAGGATLTLLEKSNIPEIKGYGGFPVSGQFLMCNNPEIVKQHSAKVYGKPEIGAPPMSVPHMDTRFIDNEKVLLFGPYAGFSTKFLKNGHWTDFFKSLRLSNIGTIISAGLRNLGLSKYLFKEVTKTHNGRFKTLLEYYHDANPNDWTPIIAGQRVQVIKKNKGISVIEFGTEIVCSEDGSIAGLLGASPGASTSVKIMLDLIEKCFGNKPYYDSWKNKLNSIIPSNSYPLHKDVELFKKTEKETDEYLQLKK